MQPGMVAVGRPPRSIVVIIGVAYALSSYATCPVETGCGPAAMLSVILTVTTANKAPGHPYRSHMAQLSKHEANKHRGNSRVSRATAKHKSRSVVADAGRVPEIAGREIEKR
jgi:hypothetical protein